MVAAKFIYLVLQATDRKPEVLVDVGQARVAAVAQAHVVGIVATATLTGTPEVGGEASIAEKAIRVAASRQRRKAVGIRAVTTFTLVIFPTRLRL